MCNKIIRRNKSKLLNSKSGIYFCSRECKDKGQSLEFGLKEIWPNHYGLSDGHNDYRDRALRKYGAVCNDCGYNLSKKMLDVHHIDSNRSNNEIGNLRVLCVWCHAMETRKNWPE